MSSKVIIALLRGSVEIQTIHPHSYTLTDECVEANEDIHLPLFSVSYELRREVCVLMTEHTHELIYTVV